MILDAFETISTVTGVIFNPDGKTMFVVGLSSDKSYVSEVH